MLNRSFLAPKNGGLPTMNSAGGQSGSRGAFRIAEVENRVHAADRFERFQHRVELRCEAVVVHPLQVADPDDDLGEFLGVVVDLDAGQLRGADGGEQADALLGRVGDDFFLQVQQQVQRDVEEVAGAAGRVEDRDVCQAVDEVAERLSRFLPAGDCLGVTLRRWPPLPASLREAAALLPRALAFGLTASHSRRSGCITTGSSSVSMSSRLV